VKYLLDTDICIYIIKQKPSWVVPKFKAHAVDSIGISTVSVSELYYGVAKSQHANQNGQSLQEFLLPLNIAPYDSQAAEIYGPIRATLERSGNTIGPLDMMIAAHALSLDVTLVTNNVSEFSRVAGLRIENWATSSP
jgi:tRNA(fMet)-specific endonuclease VapC